MVRALDLKKPPSIAESIDWARTLLLIGAEDIDRETFEQSMSIIVKHRTDIDLVAERVGVKLADSVRTQGLTPARPAWRRSCSASARSCAARGSRSAPRRSSTPSRRSNRSPWTSQDDFREALAATIAKSQDDRRVFELLFDRYFFRAAEAEAVAARHHRAGEGERRGRSGEGAASGSTSTSCASRSARRSPRATRRDARPGPAGDRRLRPPGRGLRRGRRRRAADPPHPRPHRRRRSRRPARTARSGRRSTATQLTAFERHLRRELERDLIERTATLPPSRPLAELDRALPTSPTQDLAAVHRAVSQMKRRLATLGPRAARPPQGARRSTCGGRCAPRWRPAACRCGCATGRSARAGPRSTSSATSRPRSPRPASSSSPSCTPCTTRSANCAASSSSSGSPR